MKGLAGWRLVGTMCLAMGLIYSIHWIIPVATHGDFYLPVHYSSGFARDNSFYFTHIQELMSGHLFSSDPASYENKGMLTPHVTYTLALWAAALPGKLFGSIQAAYYATYFVFPALNFLVLFLFFSFVTGNRQASACMAIFSMFIPHPHMMAYTRQLYSLLFHNLPGFVAGAGNMLELTQLHRIPNLLITNVHLVGYLIALYFYTSDERQRGAAWLLLVLTIVSPIVSSANFITVSALNGILLPLVFVRRPERRWAIVKLAFFMACGLAPLAYLNWYSYDIFVHSDYAKLLYSLGGHATPLSWGEMVTVAKRCGPILILSAVMPYRRKDYFFPLLAVLPLEQWAMYVLAGPHGFREVEFRGFSVVYGAASLAVLVLSAQWIMEHGKVCVALPGKTFQIASFQNGRAVDRLGKGFQAAAWVLVIAIMGAACINQLRVAERAAWLDRDFRELTEWASGEGEGVYVTLAPDVILNLPVYGDKEPYIPPAGLSPTPQRERLRRFYETVAFLGGNEESLKTLLANMDLNLSSPRKRYEDYRDLNSVLFYAYYDKGIPEADQQAMAKNYAGYMRDFREGDMSFRWDYAITSSRMNAFRPRADVAAEVVFENSTYRVYKRVR